MRISSLCFVLAVIFTSRSTAQNAECMKKFPYQPDDVNRMIMFGEFDDIPRNYKCFMHCTLESQGDIKDGVFQESMKKNFLTGCNFMGLRCSKIDECFLSAEGEDICEKVFGFYRCLVEDELRDLKEVAQKDPNFKMEL